MAEDLEISDEWDGKYKSMPPEGGWGYAVMLAVSLCFTVTIVPASFFGTVFGPFVATLGDEIGGTTLILGVFNTTLFLTGLPANHLLQRCTYRQVALIGAAIYFTGSFFSIFAQSVFQLVLVFGFLQGVGFGFILPSGFTALHEYFVEKENVMMSICHTIIGVMGMIWPIFTNKLMTNYGFRGTAAIFSALSLHLVLVAIIFQPVSWHYKKKKVRATEMDTMSTEDETTEFDDVVNSKLSIEEDNTLMGTPSRRNDFDVKSAAGLKESDNKIGKWKSVAKSLDLVLFKDAAYVNLAIGASMAMTSDVLFVSIVPAMLNGYGFDESNQTLILTVFFFSDLAGRALLSIINGLFRIWNRYVVLTGAILSTIFRLAFTMSSSFWWILIVSAILGSLRCCIQIPFALVFSEKYGPRFKTAFSLNMVVCGFIAFSVGILSGWIKEITNNDVMVVHLLTAVYAVCAISWLLEICIVNAMKTT